MKATFLALPLTLLLLAACQQETPPSAPDEDPPPPVTRPTPPTPPAPPEELTVTLTATPTAGDAPLTVTLEASADGYTGDYLWEFGDDSESFYGGPTQTHTYRAPGSYTVGASVGSSEDLETAYVTIDVGGSEDDGAAPGGRDRAP